MLDAFLSAGSVSSFAMLSQSERFRRQWPILYAAVEDGQVNQGALRTLLASQLPRQDICLFPLDSSGWPRPRGRVSEDLQYVYQASSDVHGGTVTVGYPYSLLEWCAEPHASWSLPVDVRRISSRKTAQAVGAEQIQALARLRADCPEVLDIVLADGKYGHSGFLQQAQGLRVGVVTRLRRDRVLYRPVSPVFTPQRGRPRKHGSRFDLQDPATWGPPDEVLEFEEERYGLVRLERWILFLARPIVADTRWPWQKPPTRLTPQRVRQSLKPIFVLIGSPAREPKRRGKPPGWPKGRPRTPKERYKVVKKGVATAQTA